jgi:hypothetical protein
MGEKWSEMRSSEIAPKLTEIQTWLPGTRQRWQRDLAVWRARLRCALVRELNERGGGPVGCDEDEELGAMAYYGAATACTRAEPVRLSHNSTRGPGSSEGKSELCWDSEAATGGRLQTRQRARAAGA